MPELPPVEPWKRHEERTLRDFWMGKMRVRENEKVRGRVESKGWMFDRVAKYVLCVFCVKCGTGTRFVWAWVGERSGPRQRS